MHSVLNIVRFFCINTLADSTESYAGENDERTYSLVV
jgi:hypothetical protein